MKLGVVSDIHDNLWNLAPAIEFLSTETNELICCGDLCSPFVMDQLRLYPGRIHIVTGNNDADLFRITSKSDERVKLYGEYANLIIEGKRIAVNHFDFLARGLAFSGLYDVVCYGHNHRLRLTRLPDVLAINPGPIMGAAFGSGGWQEVPASFVVYDSSLNSASAYSVSPGADGARTVSTLKNPVYTNWPDGA